MINVNVNRINMIHIPVLYYVTFGISRTLDLARKYRVRMAAAVAILILYGGSHPAKYYAVMSTL